MSQGLAVIIAGAFASVITYLVAVRRASGKIETTEAADLWKEAGKMREDYAQQTARCLELVERLRARIKELEDDRARG